MLAVESAYGGHLIQLIEEVHSHAIDDEADVEIGRQRADLGELLINAQLRYRVLCRINDFDEEEERSM